MSRAQASRRGFTILELAVVVVLLALLPALLLPRLLQGRQAQNEAAARERLAMLGTALTLRGGGGAPRLADLCLRTMPVTFQPDPDGVVQRQGYLYRDAPRSAPRGCWAWPTMHGYSGRACYWLDYETGAIWRVAEAAWSGRQHPPPDAAPGPESLHPAE